ncbi:MAG TPA: DUF1801 domain-containing protein [Gammaproteobacteria bacterium]|nr:DUF1801 domain-containing protein [Gammaproteobacteria bacterium]
MKRVEKGAKAKRTAQRTAQRTAKRKPAAKAKKTAKAGAKPKLPPKSGAIGVPAAAGDWREETLARMRALILEADPEMIEERKWRKASNAMAGVPVWSHDGIVCTGETYKKVVKLTFAWGARLPDPSRIFNSSLGGGTRRAIDIPEGETVDAAAFKTLVQAAVARNGLAKKKR